jgi:hypothetical protein
VPPCTTWRLEPVPVEVPCDNSDWGLAAVGTLVRYETNPLIWSAGCLSENCRSHRQPTGRSPRSGPPTRIIKPQRWAECNRQPPPEARPARPAAEAWRVTALTSSPPRPPATPKKAARVLGTSPCNRGVYRAANQWGGDRWLSGMTFDPPTAPRRPPKKSAAGFGHGPAGLEGESTGTVEAPWRWDCRR